MELPAGAFDLADHFDDLGLFEFGEAETKGFSEAEDAVEGGVEFVGEDGIEAVPERGDDLVLHAPVDSGAGEACADATGQLFVPERFDEEIIGAQFHAVAWADIEGIAGHEDELARAEIWIGADEFEHAEAVEIRHVDVAQDEVGKVLAGLADAIQATAGGDDMVTGVGEALGGDLAQGDIVINDQHRFHIDAWEGMGVIDLTVNSRRRDAGCQ